MKDLNNAKNRRARGAAQLLEQVARKVLERRSSDDLHAAQWSALRYFSRAGRQTANVVGLSKYLGNTSGSTSRTARSLVNRALLSVSQSSDDARSMTFRLTAKGKESLRHDPLVGIAKILEPMPPEQLAQLSECLALIASSIEESRTPK